MHRVLKQHWGIVESKIEPMSGSVLLMLHCPGLAASALPGQFVMLSLSDGCDPFLRIPVPIHRIYAQGISLLMQANVLPARLASIGACLDLLGPAGRGITLAAGQNVALIAQGTGIASLMSLTDIAASKITLWSWVASPGQAYPPQLIPRNVEFYSFVGEVSAESFYRSLADIPGWAGAAFASGDKAMYTELERLYNAQPFTLRTGQVQVWISKDLACGIRACGGCLVPARRGIKHCCQDGPFIDLAELML